VVAIVILWPGDDRPSLPGGLGADSEVAEVQSVTEQACPTGQPGTCADAAVQLESGPDEGESVTIQLGQLSGGPDLEVGDRIRVQSAQGTYTFVDFERRGPLLWLAIAFAVLVVVFGRLRGALSLVGLALSLLIVLGFVVPAILAGESPFAVAVAGSLAVMLVTIPLAHGLGGKSLAAMLGTTLALILTAVLALVFTELAHLTGFSFDEALTLQAAGIDISFEGLLLSGMVIGALGVLDDVTVSQASTVFALRGAVPGSSFAELFRRALDVGRDHLSATVNTLVLAYVGAALAGPADLRLERRLADERDQPGGRRARGRRHGGRLDRPDRGGTDHHSAGGMACALDARGGADRRGRAGARALSVSAPPRGGRAPRPPAGDPRSRPRPRPPSRLPPSRPPRPRRARPGRLPSPGPPR
jgi:hypothetical protein